MSADTKPLVIVIDDEPQIRRLLTVTLEANGYRVLATATGQEGLALAAQHRPALVILDLGLPEYARRGSPAPPARVERGARGHSLGSGRRRRKLLRSMAGRTII